MTVVKRGCCLQLSGNGGNIDPAILDVANGPNSLACIEAVMLGFVPQPQPTDKSPTSHNENCCHRPESR